MVYIGIDLGTTYSCVSVIEDGRPVAIISEDGKYIIPSVVAFCDDEILVGNPALDCNTDMANILYDSKRLIGWEFLHNLPNAETRQLWTFKVDTRDKCAGYVLNKGTPNERFLKPEEVSAEILKYLKICAEKYLNQKVTGVVVTVPALFQDNQKAATKKAIELAGLELKRLLHEPNAAAIAYNAKNNLGNSKLLVFDFGGGTLDVSILRMIGNNVDVKAVDGDTRLGGQDFDARIMTYALTEFKRGSSYDIDQKPKLIKKLRTKCREAKEFLSNNIEETNIFLEINDEVNLKVPLTKSQLNQLCSDLFTRAIEQVDSALNTAQMTSNDINYVILVGGSTRIPRIRELLTEKFGSNKIKLDLNPDEIVSHGAAIVANIIELADQVDRICIDNPIPTSAAKSTAGVKLTPTARPTPGDNTPVLSERDDGDNQSPKIGGDNSSNNSHRTLFYHLYSNNGKVEGRICLFSSSTCSVEGIAKFDNYYVPFQVATTQNKILGISGLNKSFEIYDLNTGQISRGPDPPEWRDHASVVYFKDKLYYLGGEDPKAWIWKNTNRVDVLIDGKWQKGPTFSLPVNSAQTITCDGVLYVIDGDDSRKIYRLSDDEREWIEIGNIPEIRDYFGVASLKGKIYITGGRWNGYNNVFKSCLCFYPSAPVDSRISRITDMNYSRYHHSLIVANWKLYAIGGFQNTEKKFCSSIEEYDPQTNKWREVRTLFYLYYRNGDKEEGRICLFNSYTSSVEEIAKFYNYYVPFQVATTQNKIFAIGNSENSFEVYDLNTRQISIGPNPPEWCDHASVVYFKDKLYYLGGYKNRVDVLIDGKWQTGPAFPLSNRYVQAITCDEALYVIDGENSRKIYQLSDDEREWIEVGEIPEKRASFGVASLNGRIYITGGWNYYCEYRRSYAMSRISTAFKSCLCFDPSAPVDSRISRIADMNYSREKHSLIVANGKLYAIGGFQKDSWENYCNSIEEYDPQTDQWREVGKIDIT